MPSIARLSTATLALVLAVAALLVALRPSPAAAAPPESLRFHGTILQLAGFSPLDGDYLFHVRIYDAAVGGQLQFEKQVTAAVAGGAYALTLEPDTPGELAEVFADRPRFLEIEVLSGPEGAIGEVLQPRQEITAVPYALSAGGGVPEGAIILWDQTGECPNGYEEAAEFRARYPVGADVAGTTSLIDDAPGVSGGDEDFRTDNAGTSSISLQANTICSNTTSCALARRGHRHTFVPPYRTVLFCRRLPPQ
jgi:hypothetical protein